MFSIEWLGARGERLSFDALDTAASRQEAEAQTIYLWNAKAKLLGAENVQLYENGTTEPFWTLR